MELVGPLWWAFEESISNGKNAFEKLLRTEKPTFGATWEVIEIPMGLIPELRRMAFIGHLQSLMITVPDSSISQNGRKVLFLQPDMEMLFMKA